MVSKLASRGMPCHDVDAARRWRDRHLEPGRRKESRADTAAGMPAAPAGIDPLQPAAAAGPVQPPAPGRDYHAARTLRENNEAELSGLRLAELRGELVRVDDVRASLARRVIAFRDGLLQIPDRLSAVLAAETDAAVVHSALNAEIRATLVGLTDAC